MTKASGDVNKNDVIAGSAVGGGLGAASGLLATLLREKPSFRKAIESMLIGGASGAVIGGGSMAVKNIAEQPPRQKEREPEPEQKPQPRQMDKRVAAGAGLLPGWGPAVHGGMSGGLEQAARSGGRSTLEGLLGAGAGVAIAPNFKMGGKPVLGMLGALAGGVHGSMAAADNFNTREREKVASAIARRMSAL